MLATIAESRVKAYETVMEPGLRFIPVRFCMVRQRPYLDTEIVAFTKEAALEEAQAQELFQYGADWASYNPLLSIAAVEVKIVEQFLPDAIEK